MGKPAARLTDTTAHGGFITGPGVPNVLIGKMPAATMGDMHMCPMVTPATPPIPHVGGPITLGSMGVFIGKKPAARMGDMAVCIGPPSSIIMGQFTVLIGESASGSQAGSAGSAAAARAAKVKGPGKIKAAKPGKIEGDRTQNHYMECEFVDTAGKPIGGVSYTIKDPQSNDITGVSPGSGKIRYDGYAEMGSYKITVKTLACAKWAASSLDIDEEVTLTCKAPGFEDGEEAIIGITLFRGVNEFQNIAQISTTIKSEKVEETWSFTQQNLDSALANSPSQVSGLQFWVIASGQAAISQVLGLSTTYSACFQSNDGTPTSDIKVEAHLPDGQIITTKTNLQGKVEIKDAPAGSANFIIIE